MTPAQVIKIAQEYGEAFLTVPNDVSQTVISNRLNQAARRAGIKFSLSYALMVRQQDLSTSRYIRIEILDTL